MREIPREELRRKLRVLNPQWDGGEIDPDFAEMTPRGYFHLLYPLVAQTDVNRAVVLMGPRRVGKTVLIWHTIQKLIADRADPSRLVYISLDTPLFQGMGLEEVLLLYREIFPERDVEGCTFFFDEVQYLAEWDRHLKVLVDQYRRTKFLASGSAAAALRRKSVESGAGRFTDFLLPPLTFWEYLELLGLDEKLMGTSVRTATAFDSIKVPDIDALNTEFLNYINFGGFPEAIFKKEIQQNPERYVRGDIIDKVLLRDLPSLYGIQDIPELNRLFQTLAYQTANEVSYEALAQKAGIAKNTIRKYIEYLEAAFLLKTVKRADDSGKTFKRTNYFKIYLANPSLFAALFDVIKPDDTDFAGHLVETAIVAQFMHDPNLIEHMHYARWSRRGGGEVDIVFKPGTTVTGCTEVKWSDRYATRPGELRALLQFCQQNGLAGCKVTTKTAQVTQVVHGVQFQFIPAAVYAAIMGRNLVQNRRIVSTA